MSKNEAEIIKAKLLEHYKDAKSELQFTNLYELIVSVILSAQCTDKRVNLITPALFAEYPDIISLANAPLHALKTFIASCSFYNNKAKNLIAMAQAVVQHHNGEIPLTREELMRLPGVGQKTANVVLIEYCGANYLAVDTHVFRTSHRLGLSDAHNVTKTEEDLTEIFRDNLGALHQAFVLFGRYICKAQKPLCETCFLAQYCKTNVSFKP